MDRTFEDRGALKKLAQNGVTLEYDQFGAPMFHAPYRCIPIPRDAQRLRRLEWLIEDGFINQIVISHDVAFKIQLMRYGGTGYAHIPRYIVPQMRGWGWPEEHIQTILVENPKRLLTFVTPL